MIYLPANQAWQRSVGDTPSPARGGGLGWGQLLDHSACCTPAALRSQLEAMRDDSLVFCSLPAGLCSRLKAMRNDSLLDSKLLANDPAKTVFYLRVSWYWCFETIRWVDIEIMTSTVAMKYTACLAKLFEKGLSLQTSTSMGRLCACAGSGSTSASLRNRA